MTGSEVMQFLVWLMPIVPTLVDAFKSGTPAIAVLEANKAAWNAAKRRSRSE